MLLRPLRLLLVLPLLLAPACDSVEAQRDFEELAYLPPNGLANDDWEVAPLFEASVAVTLAPTPNPVPTGELVTFTLRVFDEAALAGSLTLETTYDRDGDGDLDLVRLDFIDDVNSIAPQVTFDPARSNTPETGLVFTFPPGAQYRLRVLNGQGAVITYGDIQLAR